MQISIQLYSRQLMQQKEIITEYNIESLNNDSTQQLYRQRLTDNKINDNDVEKAWEKLRKKYIRQRN